MTDSDVSHPPAQVNDAEIAKHSHLSDPDSPDDFLNDAVSGSETTSDEATASLGHANDVHPELEVDDADRTESDGPVIESGDDVDTGAGGPPA